MVQIFDIHIYSDGGSIEFQMEQAGKAARVWLESEDEDCIRRLSIDGEFVGKASEAAKQLVVDINEWHSSLPLEKRERITEVQAKVGPYYDASPEIVEALAHKRVIRVRDYVAANLSE